jgi:hypothetical protein
VLDGVDVQFLHKQAVIHQVINGLGLTESKHRNV